MCYVSNTSIFSIKSSIYLWKSCASPTCGTLKWRSCEFHIILFKPRDEEINAEKINKNPGKPESFFTFFFSLFASLSVMTLSASIYTVNYARRMRKSSQCHSYKERAFMDLLLLCWGFRFLKSFHEIKKKKSAIVYLRNFGKENALISVNGNGHAVSSQ